MWLRPPFPLTRDELISLNTLNYGNTANIIEAAFLCLASLPSERRGSEGPPVRFSKEGPRRQSEAGDGRA